MCVTWGPATKAAADRQAAAIREAATEERHHRLADRAERGEFTDFADTHPCPITKLFSLCKQFGLHALADRVANGDFDATGDESDEWAKSKSGQDIARELSPEMRAIFDLKLNN